MLGAFHRARVSLPRGRSLIALGALALFALAAGIGLRLSSSGLSQTSRGAGRIVLVGLDGADWQIAEPLMRAGRMPHLAALRSRGASGSVRSLIPVLSPLLWTSVATGQRADQHGILDFMTTDPRTGARVPVGSHSRRQRALWNYFSEAGRPADVVAWWATWPAEPIDSGRIVSDRVAYSLFDVAAPADDAGLTHPPELLATIRNREAGHGAVAYEEVTRFADISREEFDDARARAAPDAVARKAGRRDPLNHFTRILAATRTYHAAAVEMLRDGRADLSAIYYQGIDEVSHRFMHFAAPRLPGITRDDSRRFGHVVERFYEYQDALLGEIVLAAGPAASILVVSDHGFVNGTDRVAGQTADIEGQPVRWHRLHGILVAAGPHFARGTIEGASLLDIAPTVLAAATLPVPAEMSGRILEEAFKPEFLCRHLPMKQAAGSRPPWQPPSPGPPASAAVSEEMMENLRSLGYVGEAAPATSALPSLSAGDASDEQPLITTRVNLAGVLMAAGDLDGAEREIAAALEAAPRYRSARHLLFELRMRQQRYDEAVALGRNLAAEAPPPGDAFLARLTAAWSLGGRIDEGVGWMRAAAASGNRELGPALARLLLERGDSDAAEEEAQAVLARDPLSETATATLIGLARRRGTLAPLEPLLADALRANPRSVFHLNSMAMLLAERDDTVASERMLTESLQIHPDHPTTLAYLGALLLHQERGNEAEPLLARALQFHPGSVEIRGNFAIALAQQGKRAEAIAHFEAVAAATEAATGRGDPAIFNALARVNGEMGDTATAIRWLRRSLDVDPNQPAMRALLAQLDQTDRPERSP